MVVGMVMHGQSEISSDSSDKALATQQPVPITMTELHGCLHGHSETSSDISDKALSTQQPVPITMTGLQGHWHGGVWSFRAFLHNSQCPLQ